MVLPGFCGQGSRPKARRGRKFTTRKHPIVTIIIFFSAVSWARELVQVPADSSGCPEQFDTGPISLRCQGPGLAEVQVSKKSRPTTRVLGGAVRSGLLRRLAPGLLYPTVPGWRACGPGLTLGEIFKVPTSNTRPVVVSKVAYYFPPYLSFRGPSRKT